MNSVVKTAMNTVIKTGLFWTVLLLAVCGYYLWQNDRHTPLISQSRFASLVTEGEVSSVDHRRCGVCVRYKGGNFSRGRAIKPGVDRGSPASRGEGLDRERTRTELADISPQSGIQTPLWLVTSVTSFGFPVFFGKGLE
jgi:hypothetical protein